VTDREVEAVRRQARGLTLRIGRRMRGMAPGVHRNTLLKRRARSIGNSSAGKNPTMKNTPAYSQARIRSRETD